MANVLGKIIRRTAVTDAVSIGVEKVKSSNEKNTYTVLKCLPTETLMKRAKE